MRFQLSFGVFVALAALVASAPISHDEIATNSAKGLHLLSLEDGAEPVWKTADEKLELMRAGTNFVRPLSFVAFVVLSLTPAPSSLMSPRSTRTSKSGPSPRLWQLPVCFHVHGQFWYRIVC